MEKKRVKNIKEACKTVFGLWKRQGKEIEKFVKDRASSEIERLTKRVKNNEIFEIVDMDRNGMIKTSELIVSKHPELTVILVNKHGDVVGMSEKRDITKIVKKMCKKCGGSGGGKGRLAQGKLDPKELKKMFSSCKA